MICSKKFMLRALGLLLVVGLVAGCAASMPQPAATSQLPQSNDPQQAAANGDYQRAADLYVQASAKASDSSRRQRLRFEAGLAAAQAGNAAMAKRILDGFLPSSLSDLDRRRYNLARREIRIADLGGDQALAQLPPPNSGVPPVVAERVWEKRAQLHFADNDLIAGIGDLVQRGVWLVDDAAQRGNDERLYARAQDAIGFGQGPDSLAARDADQTTRGWLALATIGQRRWASRADRDRALATWEQRFPSHPAARTILPDRFHYTPASTSAFKLTGPGQPQQGGPAPRPISKTIALALPLTGKFANAAEAIRDGFMFAYGNGRSDAPRPLIYDTRTMSATDIVEKARAQRVGILVGPLDKPKVANMARLASDIPEIALNYGDTPDTRPGFYEFALAPEDEAAAVARHASDKGYSRALALVPEGGWGSRVLDSFRKAFSDHGGQLVDSSTYDTNAHDHRRVIQSVLRSYKQDQGVDFIFVAAQPAQGRLIRAQLRFYRASDLPMLSTSHIYTGTVDAENDIDLNGVGFADMPWVVGTGNYIQSQRRQAEKRYGDVAKRYARLFAMGMDAWKLTERIAQQGLSVGNVFEGMTGVLALQPDGHIERYMAWAVFRRGVPRLVKMPNKNDVRIDKMQAAPRPQR